MGWFSSLAGKKDKPTLRVRSHAKQAYLLSSSIQSCFGPGQPAIVRWLLIAEVEKVGAGETESVLVLVRIAGSVPRIGFQARMRAFESHRRTIAFDGAEVSQKPLFSDYGVSSDFFKRGIDIGMCGDGKICQRKRKPITRGLQKSFLARPAGKEAGHAEMIRQRLKSFAFAEREESLSQRGCVDIAADSLDVDAEPVLTANCDQRCSRRVGHVELQPAWIQLACELGLAAGQVLETNLGSGNCKVAGKQVPQRRAAPGKVNPVFLEVKPVGAGNLIERQNAGLGACLRRFVKAHSPDVNASSGKHRWPPSVQPRSVWELHRIVVSDRRQAGLLHSGWSGPQSLS